MNPKESTIILFLCCLLTLPGMAQQGFSTTGGNSIGSGGSVSYSVGQVFYNAYQGPTVTIIQGIQQPWELSVVSAINSTEYKNLMCSVYPNPTSGLIKIKVESSDFDNLGFCLFDLNGLILLDQKIESEETTVFIGNYLPSTYFLKIFDRKNEVITFKIIKK